MWDAVEFMACGPVSQNFLFQCEMRLDVKPPDLWLVVIYDSLRQDKLAVNRCLTL